MKIRMLCTIILLLALFLTGCGKTTQEAALEKAAEQRYTETDLNHGETGYIIENGMAQPILQYSDFRKEGYRNDASDILRFCVYVETDNDTDSDGMADLVKVYVQVPTAAARGSYKAGVIFDPTPYNAGTVEEADISEYLSLDGSFDYDLLYQSCRKRTPTKEVPTYDLAVKSTPEQWNNITGPSGLLDLKFAGDYDYFLIRGYAVVQAGGLGTLGSEGFELCGFDLEAMAHKCIVEWLTGDRIAYSDSDGSNVVKADWCNGSVAMTGVSYGGTLPFEVATLGVKGLKTIIPVAGISNWYNYTNSQGVTKGDEGRYTDTLAVYNSGSLFLDDDWTVLNRDYAALLKQIAEDQNIANGNYSGIWPWFNYSDKYEKIGCSALIVQGLNDFNVTTIQADGMYQAFKAAGMTVKMILHQDGHNALGGIMVGDILWEELMNKWLSHYLLDVDNRIENMPEVMYQNNEDGRFYSEEKWRDFNYRRVRVGYEEKTNSVTSEGLSEAAGEYNAFHNNSSDGSITSQWYLEMPDRHRAVYDLQLDSGETIYGIPEIHFTASPTLGGSDGQQITALLLDVIDGEEDFPAYMTKSRRTDTLPVRTVDYFDVGGGYGYCPVKEYVKSYTKAKIVTCGWTDLANPGGGADPSDYAEDTEICAGTQYDYTLYLMPTVYTIEPGHTLKLILTTFDVSHCSLADFENYADYGYVIENASLDAEIPFLH